MTDTINNVPRELLQTARNALVHCRVSFECSAEIEELDALLSAPSPAGVYSADPLACPGCASGCFRCASPAGVDGLSASAMPDEVFADEFAAWWEEDGKYVRAGGGQYEKSFAFQAWRYLMPRVASNQAIIDGLRGEADQQAQRIGELASHLEFAVTMLTVAGLAGNAQVEAMRSALSAGHEPQ